MNTQLAKEQDKINEYLKVIEKRILEPIEKTGIQKYCTASLLLLFAAIDGLGKLLHENKNAGSKQRIKVFLNYMDGDYKNNKSKLVKLRNDVVHNAINVASFLSHTEGTVQHLEKIGPNCEIYVNTKSMYEDFKRAFERFKKEIKEDSDLRTRAADRLEWRDFKQTDLHISTTPEPNIRFIVAKDTGFCKSD